VIGIFFFSSVQLISVGIIGEYIGAIHTQVHKRPLVVERERVNFEFEPGLPSSSLDILGDALADSAAIPARTTHAG
jgi:hypothetical protein